MRRFRLIDGAGRAPDEKEEGFMKVAFATNDLKRVDAHFGGAKQMVFYDVTRDASEFVDVPSSSV